MQLSERLAVIANMVTKGNRVVDVGCDHGYIPIWLVEQGVIPGAIAMDINKGPLFRAQSNIEQHGLSPYIETRLSDGVAALREGEGDTLVIAGMGGPLMERILEDGAAVLMSIQEFILEPQSEIGHMRLYLQKHGYEITDEDMVFEDGKFYPVIKVVHGSMEPLTDEELEYGPCLLKKQHPILYRYMQYELEGAQRLSHELMKVQSTGAARRMEEIRTKKELIKSVLNYFEANNAEID